MEKQKNITSGCRERNIRELYLCSMVRNPTDMIMVSDYIYGGRTDRWHRHCDFYELVLVTGGEACSERENGCEWLQVGSLQIFQPGTVHRYCAMRDFHNFNLLFSPKLLMGENWNFSRFPMANDFFFAPGKVSPIYYLKEHDFAEVSEKLRHLLREFRTKRSGYQEAMFFEFGLILTFLLRHIQTAESQVRSASGMVEHTIHFMEENLSRPINLAELARSVNMSMSSFRHKFMEITGIPPVEYLIRLRLKRAVWLLASGESFTEVARQSGFAETNYFGRQFKKHLQISPREFMRRVEAGIDLNAVMNALLYAPEPRGTGISLMDDLLFADPDKMDR